MERKKWREKEQEKRKGQIDLFGKDLEYINKCARIKKETWKQAAFLGSLQTPVLCLLGFPFPGKWYMYFLIVNTSQNVLVL